MYELQLCSGAGGGGGGGGGGRGKPSHSRIDNCKLTVTHQFPTKRGGGKRSIPNPFGQDCTSEALASKATGKLATWCFETWLQI